MDDTILKINNSDLKEMDNSIRLARYFSYNKLKDIVNNQLYFCNCELFDDDNERKRIDKGRYKNSKALDISEKINKHLMNKCRAYVSCWTLFDSENVALWKIYDKNSTGACVVTTVGKLKEQLEPNILIGNVLYDEKINIPLIDIEGVASNYLATEFVKIEPYFFEQEVRAVFFSRSSEAGILKNIEFELLVDEVLLSPFANNQNRQRTEELLLKKIAKDKIKSSIVCESNKFIGYMQ